MKDARMATGANIVPLLAPIDKAATATGLPWVNLKNALHATFIVYFGVITATSADQNITVTMEAATAAASGTEVQIAFNYRKSGATGANTWGAVTAATATAGISADTTAEDGKMYLIDIDPNGLDSLLADASHVRMVITPDAGGTVTLVSAWVELDPRNVLATQQSAT